MPQFVAIQFKAGEGRTYTYHNDGDPVAIGDRVIIPTNHGQATVTVVGLPEEAPSFPTKSIVGMADAEPSTTS